MSWNRGAERDFLTENKQNVRFYEKNTRVAAALNALRVPRWRPVVLHYPEKLRPHCAAAARKGRVALTDIETGLARCGLAYPYGLPQTTRKLQKMKQQPCQCHQWQMQQEQQDEEFRRTGGWSENAAEAQTDDIKDTNFLNKALKKCQSKTKDNIDTRSLRSQASRASRVSRESRRVAGGAEAGNDPAPPAEGQEAAAPLSARSSASINTLKSTATLKSSISRTSRATVKSQATIKSGMSKKTMPTKDHASGTSVPKEKHQVPTEVQTDTNGYTMLNAKERESALNEAHIKYNDLIQEYNRLPVSAATLRVRNRKIAIERELDDLDYTIHMFDQPNVCFTRN
ncbi:uncharacterized protein LOC115626699 [Scaptodrosophila lebanonensis]|uniref:Uncharacterized protein LOC115626699 n=1 Tax=Drosophila lebanonensis TaxID=7225 RepID=A0A6J2TS85_DROLE|nr:uncharacterized protein LOC115626699 [Scaptodrosophila lebanonensis]